MARMTLQIITAVVVSILSGCVYFSTPVADMGSALKCDYLPVEEDTTQNNSVTGFRVGEVVDKRDKAAIGTVEKVSFPKLKGPKLVSLETKEPPTTLYRSELVTLLRHKGLHDPDSPFELNLELKELWEEGARVIGFVSLDRKAVATVRGYVREVGTERILWERTVSEELDRKFYTAISWQKTVKMIKDVSCQAFVSLERLLDFDEFTVALAKADESGDEVGQPSVTVLEVDTHPAYPLFIGDTLWISDYAEGLIIGLDPKSGEVLHRIQMDEGPFYLAYFGGYLWAAGWDTGTLTKVDPTEGLVVSTVDMGTMIVEIVASEDALWALTWKPTALVKIDPTTGKAAQRIPYAFFGVPSAFDYDGKYLWVADKRKGIVTRISPEDGFTKKSDFIANTPVQLVKAGGSIWLLCQGTQPALYRLDPDNLKVIERIPALGGFKYIRAAGVTLYTTVKEPPSVMGFNLSTGKTTFGPVQIERTPTMAVEHDNILWVTSSSGKRVFKINLPKTAPFTSSF